MKAVCRKCGDVIYGGEDYPTVYMMCAQCLGVEDEMKGRNWRKKKDLDIREDEEQEEENA